MSKSRGKSTTKARDRAAKDKADIESTKKSSALAFAVLSKEDSEELLGMSAIEMECKLQDMFQLSPTTDLKEASVLDYYVGAIYWGKGQGYNSQQLSGFFTLAHTLLHKVKEEDSSLVEVFKEFRKILVGVGAELPAEVESGGLEFFTSDQGKAIADYLQASLFQHYKLYEFMFQQSQFEEIISCDLTVEVPPAAETPFPPPLDEGISESTYRNFISIPTPTIVPVDEEAAAAEEAQKAATPVQLELPPEAEDIFKKLTAEDVQSIIQEVTSDVLNNLQTGVENKMRNYENNMLTRINKLHVVLPEPVENEEALK